MDAEHAALGWPIVFVPMGMGKVPDWGLPVDMSKEPYFIEQPIGSLSGEGCKPIDTQAELDELAARLPTHKVGVWVREVKCSNGFVAVSVCAAVHVDCYEAAVALPGFVQLTPLSGVHKTIPK